MSADFFPWALLRIGLACVLVLTLDWQLAAAEPPDDYRWPKSERFESAIRVFEEADK